MTSASFLRSYGFNIDEYGSHDHHSKQGFTSPCPDDDFSLFRPDSMFRPSSPSKLISERIHGYLQSHEHRSFAPITLLGPLITPRRVSSVDSSSSRSSGTNFAAISSTSSILGKRHRSQIGSSKRPSTSNLAPPSKRRRVADHRSNRQKNSVLPVADAIKPRDYKHDGDRFLQSRQPRRAGRRFLLAGIGFLRQAEAESSRHSSSGRSMASQFGQIGQFGDTVDQLLRGAGVDEYSKVMAACSAMGFRDALEASSSDPLGHERRAQLIRRVREEVLTAPGSKVVVDQSLKRELDETVRSIGWGLDLFGALERSKDRPSPMHEDLYQCSLGRLDRYVRDFVSQERQRVIVGSVLPDQRAPPPPGTSVQRIPRKKRDG